MLAPSLSSACTRAAHPVSRQALSQARTSGKQPPHLSCGKVFAGEGNTSLRHVHHDACEIFVVTAVDAWPATRHSTLLPLHVALKLLQLRSLISPFATLNGCNKI